MFSWLRKPKAQVLSAPIRNSFFSTDGNIFVHGESETSRAMKMQELFEKTFQRTFSDMKAVDVSGKQIAGFAMDEAYPGIQLTKYRNSIGAGIPDAQFAWYAGQGFIGYQTAAMFSQNWLIDKACTMPAKDAARHGYEVTVNDGTDVAPEVMDYIRDEDNKFGVLRNCVEFERMGRIFGIRVAMFKIDSPDPQYYTKPFNPDGIRPGSYRGISQIDPYWITPELGPVAASDPSAIDFYEPTWWRINGQRVHRTHLVIMTTGELPDILKPAYLYGGVSIPQKIAERVFAAERTANEAPMLALTKRLTTLKTDITQALSDQEAFNQRMAYWLSIQNNFGAKIIGEGDEVEQHDTSLADLDDTIMTQFQLVAAASGVPATKLLGTQPKGFNASGDYEESSYHEELESMQEHDLSPLVNRHHLILMRSHVTKKFGIKPFDTEVNWKPVDSPTAQELAELNDKKADTRQKYVNMGAVDGTDVRELIISDPDSGFNGIPDIVPGGPGDRDADQERRDLEAEAAQTSLSETNEGSNE